MKGEEVLACQFKEWYPTFAKQTFRSEIIQLPEEFISFLLRDGVFLHSSSEAAPLVAKNGEWEVISADYEPFDATDNSEDELDIPSFPDLEEAINCAIARLGGAVIPKLNWSCPKDVGWLSSTGSAKCHNAAEIFLLLKSSDTIVHDLCHAFDSCSDLPSMNRPPQFHLVLREYFDLKLEMEFRCFVHNYEIIGISQRNITEFYPQLLDLKFEISEAIQIFFVTKVDRNFPFHRYVMDLYVTPKKKLKIVDFNVWGGATLPLLFTWEELEEKAKRNNFGSQIQISQLDPTRNENNKQKNVLAEEPELRIIDSPVSVRPNLRAMAGVPLDLYNLEPGGAIDDFLKRNAHDSS